MKEKKVHKIIIGDSRHMAEVKDESVHLVITSPKYLWIKLNEEDKIPAYDAATLHKFDEGHLAGGLAKKFFPKGIDIPTEDFMGNIKKTKEFIAQGKLLFGAGILYNRICLLNE
jgi:DNA modification methylase